MTLSDFCGLPVGQRGHTVEVARIESPSYIQPRIVMDFGIMIVLDDESFSPFLFSVRKTLVQLCKRSSGDSPM